MLQAPGFESQGSGRRTGSLFFLQKKTEGERKRSCEEDEGVVLLVKLQGFIVALSECTDGLGQLSTWSPWEII